MSSLHHRIRHRFDRCARRAAGVVGIVLVLTTSSWAQTPGYDQRPYAQPVQPPVYSHAPSQPPYAAPPGQPYAQAPAQPPYPQQPSQSPVYGQPQQPPDPQAQPDQQPCPQAPGQSAAYGQPQPPVYGPSPGQPPVSGQPGALVPADGRMQYRGFRIDGTQILNSPQYAAIMASMPRQIDIVMASGVRPDVLRFFQSQVIVLHYGLRGQFGHFDPHFPGVSIEDAVADPQKPIVLHELLHAYHWYVIPGGFQNSDILTFYDRAVDNHLYESGPPCGVPSTLGDGAYVSKNVQEYFAVTASLYLWGHVDRPPFTRENLRARQPIYYQWLARFFDVQK
jgi:hypothetical protein